MRGLQTLHYCCKAVSKEADDVRRVFKAWFCLHSVTFLIAERKSFGWPTYSPDLASVDFSFRGYIKGRFVEEGRVMHWLLPDRDYFLHDHLLERAFCKLWSIGDITTRCQFRLDNDGDVQRRIQGRYRVTSHPDSAAGSKDVMISVRTKGVAGNEEEIWTETDLRW